MKRLSVVLVILLLTTAMVYSAGTTEAKPQEVQTLVYYRYSSAAHDTYNLPLIEAFMKENPDIVIESVVVTSGGYEALASKVLLANAAGTPPDVAQVGYSLINTMVESGNAIELGPFMAKDPKFSKKSLFPAMMDLGAYGDKQYLIPLGTSTPIMLYNKELFQQVGLNPENPPKSWAEVEAASQILKDAGFNGVLWGWSITGNWILQTMIENAGGKLATPDSSVLMFNQEPGVKVMTYLQDLVKKGLMPVTDQTLATFATGKLGMLIDSSFQRVSTPNMTNFTVMFAPVPTLDGSTPIVPAGGNGVMMFAQDAKKQEAAWRFLRFLTEETASMIIGEQSGYTPANESVISTLKTKYAADKNFAITLDQAAKVVPWHAWPGENGAKINKVLRDMQESILLQKISPKAGLDKAAADIQALL
ncbi:MAG: hypothetical protein CVV52_05700 [Spirochaetae bacterium HGW-Spirochaetae-8]|jgi:multiple sugar transport system substrate-binding protein|nr:MAG: hypothetical protein CVV52_05700 [Spirochaetae bacterium HGW-Spirochaetae-8]